MKNNNLSRRTRLENIRFSLLINETQSVAIHLNATLAAPVYLTSQNSTLGGGGFDWPIL